MTATTNPARIDPKRRRNRLILIGALILAALVAGVAIKLVFFSHKPARVMTSEVSVGDVEETVLANGTLKPIKLVAVGSQASGRVVSIKAALGQKVRQGELIAQIDSVTQENTLRSDLAALADVRAQLVEKQATMTRVEQTLARQQQNIKLNAVSRSDLETAQADVKTTRAQIQSLRAQIIEAQVAVKTAQANLGYTQIRAPIDGTVLRIVTQQGQTVNAAQSAPTIVILGQVDQMTIRAEISEADVVRVKPGQPVYFTVLGDPDRRYDASLDSIEPAPESITNDSSFNTTTTSSSTSSSTSSAIYYNGVFSVPNPEGRLRTYMTAEVHIVLGQVRGVLTIPSAALTKGAGGRYSVRVMGRDGKTTVRAVEVGLNNKITAEIRSGLSRGERVVTGEIAPAGPGGGGAGGGSPPMML
ncbi:MAG: efflux RND transporter periplasmic adaptor subunit [Caulobacteraceae bacterium]|nr:efflux RND transporter periplasmic adaptor subunit [Caulobacteraceae bacterium]